MQSLLSNYITDNLHSHIQVLPKKSQPSYWVTSDQVKKFERVKLHLNDRHFLMTDYDHSLSNPLKLYDIKPNIIIYNPLKSTHQAFWLLATPVHCQNKQSPAYRYLRAIENGFDSLYGCDQDFRRHIHRNPLYSESNVSWLHAERYKLKHLAEVVDLKAVISREDRSLHDDAEGRNSELFNVLRQWAYKQIKNLSECDFDAFTKQLIVRANIYNTFSIPLPDSEVKTIARSISRFCIARINDTAKFSERQAIRGAVGGKKSKGGGRPSIDNRLLGEIRTLKSVHKYSNRKIAKELGISPSTVTKYSLL